MRPLFHKPFDITQFRRPQQPILAPSSPQCKTFTDPPKHLDSSVPQFVKKPIPTQNLAHLMPPPLIIEATNSTTEEVRQEDGGDAPKKSKKHKKEKKHRRNSLDDADEDGLGLDILCKALGVDHFTPTPTPYTSIPAPPPPPTTPTATRGGEKRAFDQAFERMGSFLDPDFDMYMASPAGKTVNDQVCAHHGMEVSAASSTHKKTLGERKYGCTFCGALHQLDCLEKGGDPQCVRGGSFAKFIQDFLFRYDVAPNQEWRRMFLGRIPGFRRAMAERFAVITSHEADDVTWTSFMQRRAWDTRSASYNSNAGSSRELFQQSRASEFLYFNSSGVSSPRPGSVTALSPIPSFGSIASSYSLYGESPYPHFNA